MRLEASTARQADMISRQIGPDTLAHQRAAVCCLEAGDHLRFAFGPEDGAAVASLDFAHASREVGAAIERG